MIPWKELDRAKTPDNLDLRLMRRGTEFSIMLGGNGLMNSRLFGSEEHLAEFAAAALKGRRKAEVLIGGLGMGFTLRAALAAFAPDARITVAELMPAVVTWARGPLADLFEGALDDPRVDVHQGDVAKLIAASPGRYDAILLDVDNGPEALTQADNDTLYGAKGLAEQRRALRPGGVLAVWSAHPDPGFARRLAQAGFKIEEHRVRARKNGKGARHLIWTGVKL